MTRIVETPSFTFRLQRVQSLRERAEARAQEDLAHELRLRLRGEAMLMEATHAASAARETGRDAVRSRATGMDLIAAQAYIERAERERREEIAREKGEAMDVAWGSQIRSYVLNPYTMVKDHRTDFEMGDANRVLDGDLDGFVRAYLLKAAAA